jgi:chemotaxis protein CheD
VIPLRRDFGAEAALGGERRRRFLQPGQVIATMVPTEITTILGSCVAVCMWDPQARLGGMNHFLLPQQARGRVASPRCGAFAMSDLFARLVELGAEAGRLQASVYGGACMFQHLDGPEHLGSRNAEVALEGLRKLGITPLVVDVGGNRGRKLRFVSDEGESCSTSI